jgi:transposase
MAEPNSDRMLNLMLELLELKRRLAEMNRLLVQRRLAQLRQIDAEIANLDRHGKENKKP